MAKVFQVEIDNSGLNTTSPSEGFIDPVRIEDYMAKESFPTDYDASLAKRKANRRWRWVVEKIHQMSAVYIRDIETPDADADTAPSALNFVAVVEAGVESLYTEDETSPGTFLSGADALKRAIARAMVVQLTQRLDVYDPTTVDAPDNPKQAVRRIVRVEDVVVGRLADTLTDAEAVITITELY